MLGRFLTPITLVAVLACALVAAPVSASATAHRPVPLVTAIATNSPFSPNHDGVKDLGAVRYRLTKSAYVTVRVSRHGTTVLQRSVGRLRAGTHSFVWNGVSRGRVVPDATYTVSVVARRTLHSTPRTTSRSLTVEARPEPADGKVRLSSGTVYPRTTVIHDVVVGEFSPGRQFRADLNTDPNAYNLLRLQVLDQHGRVVGGGAVQGCDTACGRFTWDGRSSVGFPRADGTYRIRLINGRDRAGNPRVAAPPVSVQVSSTQLVAVTTTTSRPAADFQRLEQCPGGPYTPLGCGEGSAAAKPSARFDHGLSYDTRCPPNPLHSTYCTAGDRYVLPFTGRRTPSDRFTITAHGGPTTAGSTDIGHFSAGGARGNVTMQGDTAVTLNDVPFASNTEVPVPGGVSGLLWSFFVAADGSAYDVASFDVTSTTYAPAP